MSIIPYLKPDLDQSSSSPGIYVSGSLSSYVPLEEYSGHLTIHNYSGQTYAKQIGGDVLPPGSSITASGSDITVSWPAYSEVDATIKNPGLEDGASGWVFGQGWDYSGENPIAGVLSGRFLGYTGTSYLSNTSRYKVQPGTSISAGCSVRQGASSAGNAGAAVALEYRDGDGNILRRDVGNAVMSASNNEVKPSNVLSTSPDQECFVNISADGIRKSQNKAVYVDTFHWNVKSITSGTSGTSTFFVVIQVSDSTGRTAVWQGYISLPTKKLTGTLFPLFTVDNIVSSPSMTLFTTSGNPFYNDSISTMAAPSMVEFSVRANPSYSATEPATAAPSMVEFTVKLNPQYSDSIGASAAPSMQEFNIKENPQYSETYGTSAAPSMQEFSVS